MTHVKTRILITILLHFMFSGALDGHPWKPGHYVIIDTDGGTDDMKAISMLLASPDVRVLAVIASPGVLSAENAYIKVKSLLNSFYHEGIPAGINNSVRFAGREMPVALEYSWGPEEGIDPSDAPGYADIVRATIKAEKTNFSFICLGGASTAWSVIRDIPEARQRIRDFIWSADGMSDTGGFNYNIDKKSSASLLKQEIPVKIVRRALTSGQQFYSEEFTGQIEKASSVYALKISDFLRSETAGGHSFSYDATDEMVPLFLHFPELFVSKTLGNVSDCSPSVSDEMKASVIKILKGETVGRNQVIKAMPDDPSFYFDDIAPSVATIINRYGIDEWSSGVVANELHRHLGVFAIVGVKMGIRAREYFNTGVDEFSVVSYAGSVPPLSCMNDGLQVSTGATPGHGLLRVADNSPLAPSAEFSYMGHRIRLTLKKELATKLTSELEEINFIYGLDSNIYWELVRKNSVRYWLSLDRHDIFDIEVVE